VVATHKQKSGFLFPPAAVAEKQYGVSKKAAGERKAAKGGAEDAGDGDAPEQEDEG